MSEALTLPEPELGPAGAAYERFLREAPESGDDYLRTDARVRFEPRDDDVLLAPLGLTVSDSAGGALLAGGTLPQAIVVPGVSRERVAAFLAALDGSATLAAARARARLDSEAEQALLRAAFGVALFAPHTVTALERAVSGADIVRFPGAPYEIERNYWTNMAAVRAQSDALEANLDDARRAFTELSRLHAVALVGEDGGSFYRPQSRVVRRGLLPGALWHAASRTEETSEGTRLLEGPRVQAPLIGGEAYAGLLAELTGDPEATLPRREHTDEGLGWGRVVTGRAEGDAAAGPWFCPPRPITLAHAESLFGALRHAVRAQAKDDQRAALDGLADFHQRFVRLHPYRACNQALAMNLVNAVLGRVAGAGMPHLLLDHVALRFAPAAYRRLFALAARQWCVEGAPAARLTHLLRKKGDYFALVGRLAATSDADAAAIVARTSPEAARLALLDFG
jgi:hypothetical protein